MEFKGGYGVADDEGDVFLLFEYDDITELGDGKLKHVNVMATGCGLWLIRYAYKRKKATGNKLYLHGIV